MLCIYKAYFADCFQNQLYRKFLPGIPPECQIVWIQIRPDDLTGLIWVQNVWKGCHQTALLKVINFSTAARFLIGLAVVFFLAFFGAFSYNDIEN